MSTAISVSPTTQSDARRWFDEHLAELQSRCRTFVRRLPPGEREEATAEILAGIFDGVLKAEQRGKLRLLTPYLMVSFVGRSYYAGRRLAGASPQDVLSTAVQRRHNLRVVSLDSPGILDSRGRPLDVPLSDALPDPKVNLPDENTRRNLDYPAMLDREGASRQARRTFGFLVETLGEGRGKDLARELRVSPPRICQIKDQLGRMLSAHGYGPSKIRRSPAQKRRWAATRKPHRLAQIPLNAGTTPSRCRRSSPTSAHGPATSSPAAGTTGNGPTLGSPMAVDHDCGFQTPDTEGVAS